MRSTTLFKDHLLTKVGIDKALTEAENAWQMVGALTSLPHKNAISATERELTLEQLQLMAERTVKLFTVAYDGEGYLIWHRAPTRRRGR